MATTDFYTDAIGESGFQASTWNATSFASARAEAGNALTEDANLEHGYWMYNFPPDKWIIQRSYAIFDTSAGVGGDTISAADVSIHAEIAADNRENDGTDYIQPVKTTFTDEANPAVGDYAQYDETTPISDTTHDLSSISTVTYTTWAMNSDGLNEIDVSGKTPVGFLEGHDIENEAPTAPEAAGWSNRMSGADYANTGKEPWLHITHDPAASAHNALSLCNF